RRTRGPAEELPDARARARPLGGAGDAESALVVLIAGAADEAVLADVRTQYEQLGPASAIPPLHFLGARDDIAELAATADVYVLTSVWEARALVLQEALIAGKAIVATATGGSPELVGDAGLLVADDDDRALAEAVAELASDPARRAELGARARARAAQLPDEREVADTLVSLYTELAAAEVGQKQRRSREEDEEMSESGDVNRLSADTRILHVLAETTGPVVEVAKLAVLGHLRAGYKVAVAAHRSLLGTFGVPEEL